MLEQTDVQYFTSAFSVLIHYILVSIESVSGLKECVWLVCELFKESFSSRNLEG